MSGLRIKQYREKNKYSQKDLAGILGVSTRSITIILLLVILASCKEAGISNTSKDSVNPDHVSESSMTESEILSTEFENLLGYDSVRVEIEAEPGMSADLLLFINNADGKIVAECGRFDPDEPGAYFVEDVDCDGIAELICNYQYATGAERVVIYSNNAGVIECGTIREEYICDTLGIQQPESPYTFTESYDPETDSVTVTLQASYYEEVDEDQILEVSISDKDAFEFTEYQRTGK